MVVLVLVVLEMTVVLAVGEGAEDDSGDNYRVDCECDRGVMVVIVVWTMW